MVIQAISSYPSGPVMVMRSSMTRDRFDTCFSRASVKSFIFVLKEETQQHKTRHHQSDSIDNTICRDDDEKR